MHGLDAPQLAQLKAALTNRLAALACPDTGDAGIAGTHVLPVDEVETAPADKATVRLLNDLALEAAEHQHALAPLLRHALARIDEGTYGECEACGTAIGFARLQARPEARLCFACQTRAERRQP
jgi:DnaK suppressor protein